MITLNLKIHYFMAWQEFGEPRWHFGNSTKPECHFDHFLVNKYHNSHKLKILTCLYLFKDGVFSGGPENGIDIFVSKNFSESNPPITVPYLLKETKMLPS